MFFSISFSSSSFFDPETKLNILIISVTNVFYNRSNFFQKYIFTFFSKT